MKPEEILVADQVELLREVIRNGGTVTLLKNPPTDQPGCDDYAGRFTWYKVVQPLAEGETKPRVGYVHFEHEVL